MTTVKDLAQRVREELAGGNFDIKWLGASFNKAGDGDYEFVSVRADGDILRIECRDGVSVRVVRPRDCVVTRDGLQINEAAGITVASEARGVILRVEIDGPEIVAVAVVTGERRVERATWAAPMVEFVRAF